VKALIVDDCELSRQLMILCIEAYADIDLAGNGEEAIELAKQAIDKKENYNLICVDLNMPLVDGHETMQSIRKLETDAGAEKAVFFMITSSNAPDDMIKAISLGQCNDYMMKPVMRKTFLELLKKHNLIPEDAN
jgi:two-component system chemotaxis response regulator CheY